MRAEVVAFDPNRDLAVLRAATSTGPRCPRDTIEEGGVGAVFGHPGGGPLRAAPFSGRPEVTATGTDIYDRDADRRARC